MATKSRHPIKTKKKQMRLESKSADRKLHRQYKSFRASKRIKHPTQSKLTGSVRLLRKSIRHILKYWKLFFGIVIVYFILTIVLVKGFGISSGITELKNELDTVLVGKTGAVSSSVALLSYLATSSAVASGDIASLYQSILLLVVSLALIWALRQTHAGEKVTAKHAFYKSSYPMVQFMLVALVIIIQLIPLLIGNWLFSTIVLGGIAATAVEIAIWSILFFLLALLSLYMVTSSIFALYIVTLPDVEPMQALRSAREVVRYRRWTILRRIIFLPIILLILTAVIMIPTIIFLTAIAEWVFFIMTMFALAVVHAYFYELYRELL